MKKKCFDEIYTSFWSPQFRGTVGHYCGILRLESFNFYCISYWSFFKYAIRDLLCDVHRICVPTKMELCERHPSIGTEKCIYCSNTTTTICSVDRSKPVYIYHGTNNDNIRKIIQEGYTLEHCGKSSGSHDENAVFCTENPAYAYNYSRSALNNLNRGLSVNRVDVGKMFVTNDHTKGCKEGYDSHITYHFKGYWEYVIFDVSKISPVFHITLPSPNK